MSRLVHEGLLHLLNACLQYCSLHKQAAAAAAALEALAAQPAGGGTTAAGGVAGAGGDDEGDDQQPAQHAGPARPQLAAARRAELQRVGAEAAQRLGALRREFGSRQRLLLRVLSTKAAEAGSHADELRQLLGALDFNGHFASGMA